MAYIISLGVNHVPTRVAVSRLGVCSKTLERWEQEGKIKTIKTKGGQRRYDINSVVAASGTRQTILYARVSTRKQKDDLGRQIEYLVGQYPGCEVIKDFGSGLNFKRKGLLALLARILSGSVELVVVANKDRLARFGTDLIAWIASQFGCKILVLNHEISTPEREMLEDVIAIIHVFSCRFYGLRNYRKAQENANQNANLPSVS